VTSSPDATLLATASDDGTARIWDVACGVLRVTLVGSAKDGYAIFSAER
jgi:WD40 repeat protein